MGFSAKSWGVVVSICAVVALGGCAGGSDSWSAKTSPSVSGELDLRPAGGDEADEHPAAAHVRSIGAEAVVVLSAPNTSDDQRIEYFRRLIERDLHVNVLARFVLGKHWKRSSANVRQDFTATFGNFVAKTYAKRIASAQVSEMKIAETVKVGKRDVMVRTRVKRFGGKPMHADWRLRLVDGRYRIVDLAVEGISMAVTMRQEFASVLRKKGGIQALITTLRGRMALASASPGPV